MANIINSFLGYLKLNDDEEDFIDDIDIKEVRSQERPRKNLPPAPTPKAERVVRQEEPVKDRPIRMERTTTNKIVPIRTTPKGLEVCILKPSCFEDSQDICDMLLTGRAAVVNLEGFDPEDAQRVMDFISGCVYAINGKLHQISKFIFIFSPDNIDISGDYEDFLPEGGFDVPTINKEF